MGGGGAAVSVAVDLLVALLNNAAQISQLIQLAQSAGQTTLTADQWATVIGTDDSAEAALTAAIDAARSGGH